MASYCAKCGSELYADSKFCASCGARTDLGASPVTPAGQVPAAAPKSGGAFKVILIVIAVFVGLGVLTAAGAMSNRPGHRWLSVIVYLQPHQAGVLMLWCATSPS